MGFNQLTGHFLRELAANNNRDWFEVHRQAYEQHVREPALAFIEAMQPHLANFAPEFEARASKVGGSLMRIHRDTRFARDKSPYKTNVGIQFRHKLGKDVHAPGYYVHLATDGCFLGVGCWRPAPEALRKIRQAIADKLEAWLSASRGERFVRTFALAGESLNRPPRDFAADHPAIDDLKRKDYIAMMPLDWEQIDKPNFVELVAHHFAEATPLMRFLCQSLGVRF